MMNKQVLVKGYTMVHEFSAMGIILNDVEYFDSMEILFAVYPDGTVTTSGVRKYSTSFDKKGETWEVVSELPDNVEFIGNYYMDPVKA